MNLSTKTPNPFFVLYLYASIVTSPLCIWGKVKVKVLTLIIVLIILISITTTVYKVHNTYNVNMNFMFGLRQRAAILVI